MTVRELIDLLQSLPSDLPVYLRNWSDGYPADIPIDDGGSDGRKLLLPRVVDARADGRAWAHPRRVVIG